MRPVAATPRRACASEFVDAGVSATSPCQSASDWPVSQARRSGRFRAYPLFTVRWEDPDAPRVETPLVCWDDPCGPPPEPCVQPLATGAWTPPRPLPGEGELRFTHTYRTAGPHRVTIALRSHAWPEQSCPPGPGDPYSDTVVLSTMVTTRGAA